MDPKFNSQTGVPLTGIENPIGKPQDGTDAATKPETKPIPAEQVQVTEGPEVPSQNDPQRPYDEKSAPTMSEFLELKSRIDTLEAFAKRFATRFRDK